ncbi:hypothetical protein ISF_02249 [Cordyceps fumosorosea ARSEF 2679]|uniref:Uncharacterized protein n=1 Tax=Cordyceps fumosorosea (strain ARSEF 2679) TaxID=1081104 RepID=A0A168BLK4_CORFA|nr:hypothetical protein ISF_02249 [Cordyceps fumosorosea ARSEF 2679]OAA70275.1 hypothetical protein ISF_02249 [Cordyceps fumosorosea ARSEF 2679]
MLDRTTTFAKEEELGAIQSPDIWGIWIALITLLCMTDHTFIGGLLLVKRELEVEPSGARPESAQAA